jgi:hypothetical protein
MREAPVQCASSRANEAARVPRSAELNGHTLPESYSIGRSALLYGRSHGDKEQHGKRSTQSSSRGAEAAAPSDRYRVPEVRTQNSNDNRGRPSIWRVRSARNHRQLDSRVTWEGIGKTEGCVMSANEAAKRAREFTQGMQTIRDALGAAPDGRGIQGRRQRLKGRMRERALNSSNRRAVYSRSRFVSVDDRRFL